MSCAAMQAEPQTSTKEFSRTTASCTADGRPATPDGCIVVRMDAGPEVDELLPRDALNVDEVGSTATTNRRGSAKASRTNFSPWALVASRRITGARGR